MRSVVPTRRGIGFLVAAAVLFVAAPLLSLPALQQVTALLLGLVAAAAVFVVVGQTRIAVDRSFTPEVVAPGQVATATVHVTNTSALPCLPSGWSDTVGTGLSAAATGTLPALGGSRSGRARASLTYELRGLRRGRHAVGPLRIEVQDPFGLVRRRHVLGGSQHLVVLPRRVELWPLAPHGADTDGASRPAPQHAGIGADDVIARTYLPGDALKRMHWKATAHRGVLMVRQEEQEVNPRAGVVLDRDATAFGTVPDRSGAWEHSPSFEWAVTAAASVVAHLHRVGYAVTTRSPGEVFSRTVTDGEDTLEDALADLAVIEPRSADDLVPHDVDPEERTVFVVLGRLGPDRARRWADALSGGATVLALVARGTDPTALDVLSAARWRVVTYGPQDDVADLWSELDGSRARAAS